MACEHPPIPKSPGANWIERVPGGHTPEAIDCIARALYHSPGKASGDKQKAYEMAVGIAQNFARGQGAGAAKQGTYVKAVAEWEALRAASKANTSAAIGQTVSYTLQRGPRKGQTITIRRTAGGWHEVGAHRASSTAVIR